MSDQVIEEYESNLYIKNKNVCPFGGMGGRGRGAAEGDRAGGQEGGGLMGKGGFHR